MLALGRRFAVIALAVSAATPALAAVFNEVEPNNTKATAQVVNLTGVGDVITGTTTGTSTSVAGVGSADYYLLNVPTQPTGIYRNRFTISTTTSGHSGSIRGLSQSAQGTNGTGPAVFQPSTDNIIQNTSGTNAVRYNAFYTFGTATSVNYRVSGAAATTAAYNSTWSQDEVTATDVGTYTQGSFAFTNLGLSDLDLDVVLLDSSFLAIAQNHDALDTANGGPVVPAGGSPNNTYLTATLAPGTYYLAISTFNTTSNLLNGPNEGTASTGAVDSPYVIANSNSATTFASAPFNLIHSGNTYQFNVSKPEAYDVFFAKFTVTVPEPATLSLALLGGPLLMRRRR